jgi:hypothetical protein
MEDGIVKKINLKSDLKKDKQQSRESNFTYLKNKRE